MSGWQWVGRVTSANTGRSVPETQVSRRLPTDTKKQLLRCHVEWRPLVAIASWQTEVWDEICTVRVQSGQGTQILLRPNCVGPTQRGMQVELEQQMRLGLGMLTHLEFLQPLQPESVIGDHGTASQASAEVVGCNGHGHGSQARIGDGSFSGG